MAFYSYQNPIRQKIDLVRQDVFMFQILIFSLIDAWIETAQYNTPLIILALLACDFDQVPILRTSQRSCCVFQTCYMYLVGRT